MADMIGDGASWLADQLNAFAAVDVTYSRAGDPVSLRATYGRSTATLTDELGGTRLVQNEDDWLIRVSDLILSSGLTEPLLGDVITAPTGPKAGRYELLQPAPSVKIAEKVNAGTMWRCHCKRIGDQKP